MPFVTGDGGSAAFHAPFLERSDFDTIAVRGAHGGAADAFGDNKVLAVDGAHSVGTLERTRQFEIVDLGYLAVLGEIEAEELAGGGGFDVELVGIAQEGEAVDSGEQRVGGDFNSRSRALGEHEDLGSDGVSDVDRPIVAHGEVISCR
jgi:hypothetical protein